MESITQNATHHTEPAVSRQLLRRIGLDIYMEGRPESDCLTLEEKIGWREGLNTEAECATPGYAESQGY